jgi:hypothetical protein
MIFFCLLDVIQKLSVLSSDSGKMLGTIALAPETLLDRLHQQKKYEYFASIGCPAEVGRWN